MEGLLRTVAKSPLGTWLPELVHAGSQESQPDLSVTQASEMCIPAVRL